MTERTIESTIERPQRLLLVVARPAQPEVELGGVVAGWVREGTVARLVCATDGEASGPDATPDPVASATTAEANQRVAATTIGYQDVVYLHRPDGAVANDLALREQLVRQLRAFRPDHVIAPDPRHIIDPAGRINPADRRATGLAVIDAIGPAAQPMAFRGLARSEDLEPWTVARLSLVTVGDQTAASAITMDDIVLTLD